MATSILAQPRSVRKQTFSQLLHTAVQLKEENKKFHYYQAIAAHTAGEDAALDRAIAARDWVALDLALGALLSATVEAAYLLENRL